MAEIEPTLKEQLDFLEGEIQRREEFPNRMGDYFSKETIQQFTSEISLFKAICARIKFDYLMEEKAASMIVDPEEKIEFDDLISKDEFIKLSESLKCDEEVKEIEMERLFKWATEMRGNAAIVEMLIDGTATIEGWNDDGSPALSVPSEFLEMFGRETPMFEESSVC